MKVERALNDPDGVRVQYASEVGLAARKAAYRETTGADALQVTFDAVVETTPARVLEVGCGEGELAERLVREAGAVVTAIDQSPRMVELARARGVNASAADVQDLPFEDESFDVVVAAHMLYHVPDLDRGLEGLARVLVPGGRLVATTNAADHLQELLELGGVERPELTFGAENGAQLLEPHFVAVERRDAFGTVTFRDIGLVRAYFGSSDRLAEGLARLPEELETPLVARRCPVVFVATKAAA